MTAVLLVNPKNPFNVGNALRACSNFGVPTLRWTGDRVNDPRDGDTIANVSKTMKASRGRLPREERMKYYRNVNWSQDEHALPKFIAEGFAPVCLELLPGSENLTFFEHPENPVYVFGPEDGDVPKGVRTVCHHFVQIPSLSCVNLSAAVYITLNDRIAKAQRAAAESLV